MVAAVNTDSVIDSGSTVASRRHPAIAFIAGQFTPGLGFLLTGRPLLAAITWAALALAIVVLPMAIIDGTLPIGVEYLLSTHYLVFSVGSFITAIAAAALAVRDNMKGRPAWAFERLARAQQIWIVIGVVVVSFAARHALWKRVLEPNVVVYALVPETSMAPTFEPWARVSVIKRGFLPHKLAINDVVGIKPESTAFDKPYIGVARVIATAGMTVKVDDNGDVFVDGFPVIRTPCDATVPHNGRSCTHEKQAATSGAYERLTTATSFPRTFAETSVGVGQVFVLPDDRGRKLEAPNGLVAISEIVGHVVAVR